MFWSIGISVVFATTQLTGQLVLALATIVLLAYLEVVDSVCDVRSIEAAFTAGTILDTGASANQSPPIRLADVVPVALLGIHAFFGMGHQSTISTIQWKAAFRPSHILLRR